jgi:hypothetical protein
MNTTTKQQGKETILSVSMAIGFLAIVFGISIYGEQKTQRIIISDNIDISDSALEFKFLEPKQTYPLLVKEHCRRSLQLLTEGDILISGKFAAETFFRNLTINHKVKSELLKQCSQATAKPTRFPSTKGTDLLLVLNQTQTQIENQRNNGINYPVALIIVIDAAEPVSIDQFNENTWTNEVKKSVENLLKQGNIAMAFIVTDGELKKTLTTTLATLAPVKFYDLESGDRQALEWVIKTARNLPQKSPKNLINSN